MCPHCGGATGVEADPTLTAEERRAAVDLAVLDSDRYSVRSYSNSSFGYDPELALLGGVALAAAAVGVVVKTAALAVTDERSDRESRPELPRAYARERTAPPLIPEPSREPEPAPPPSDKPRFLK
ncbi:hypothetical protein BH11MYX3_BH11MYX3_02040 [soil metagenome]